MLDALHAVLVAPFRDMAGSPAFLVEVLIGGLFAGLMYSLVALGFVLIFKASGVFNFAQGVMVLFAALTLVGLLERGAPVLLALGLTTAVMVALAFAIERLVLRPLVNQEHIILFMATIGLNFFLEGFGEMLWGANVKKLDIGIPDRSFIVRGVQINQLELTAAVTAAVLVTVLAVFFQRTRIGRALRAVADDHEAALSIGVPLRTIWVVVWSVAGVVAIVAGLMWGAKSGVQFSLSLIALKALPVLILGGFESVPGAIVGGLIIGIGEKLGEVYWGPLVGGAIENWFAYVLALAFLLIRPQGLYGEKIIERVLLTERPRSTPESKVAPGAARGWGSSGHPCFQDCPHHRALDIAIAGVCWRGRRGSPGPARPLGRLAMIYREAGQFKETYASDQAIFPIVQDRVVVVAAAVAAFVVPPLVASEYWLQAVLIPFLIYALAAIGLNLLTGYAGQLSLGTGGFMAVGAYAAFKLATAFPSLNIIVVFLLSGLVAAGVGLLFGIPSLRIKGFYLAVATLASQFFLIWLFNKVAWFTNYASSGTITAPDRTLFGVLVTGPNP